MSVWEAFCQMGREMGREMASFIASSLSWLLRSFLPGLLLWWLVPGLIAWAIVWWFAWVSNWKDRVARRFGYGVGSILAVLGVYFEMARIVASEYDFLSYYIYEPWWIAFEALIQMVCGFFLIAVIIAIFSSIGGDTSETGEVVESGEGGEEGRAEEDSRLKCPYCGTPFKGEPDKCPHCGGPLE